MSLLLDKPYTTGDAMYMKRMLEIGVAENGYVIDCRVPVKRGGGTEPGCCCDSGEKQFVAKTVGEVGELIAELIPALEGTYTDEDEFDAAFEGVASK